MTLDELSYNLLNLLRGGRSNHNEHISQPQIEFNIHHYRALLLRRDYQRNRFVSRHAEQDLKCVELVVVDASQCCGLPIGCIVSRSKNPIPRAIRFNDVEALTINDVTGLHTIPLVPPHHVQTLPYDRFTKNTRKAYMIQDYLYIYNPDGIDTINIRGVFEDPTALKDFQCGTGKCYDSGSEYPLPMDLVEALTGGLLKGTFQLLPMTQSDTLNDAAQGTGQQQRMKSDGDSGDQ